MTTYDKMKQDINEMLSRPADALRGELVEREALDTRELIRKVTTEAVKRFGEGVCVSHPLPDVVNDCRMEDVFLFRRIPGRPSGPRPFAMAMIDAESGEILSYQDVRILDQALLPEAQRLNHQLPAEMKLSQYRARIDELYELCRQVRTFAFSQVLSQAQAVVLRDYAELLMKTVPEGHGEWYRAMGKHFFSWMAGVIGD